MHDAGAGGGGQPPPSSCGKVSFAGSGSDTGEEHAGLTSTTPLLAALGRPGPYGAVRDGKLKHTLGVPGLDLFSWHCDGGP